MSKSFLGPIEDEPVEFTEASALANIISGESLKVIFGKILKLFNGSTGHDHNGTNSKKIVVANVTNAVADTGDSMTGQLIVQPATDVVPIISRLKASGAANIQEWQDSASAAKFAVAANGNFVVTPGTAPSAANATGVAGTLIIAADGIYLCTATNTWVKAALATW